jgi:hypothetical protein
MRTLIACLLVGVLLCASVVSAAPPSRESDDIASSIIGTGGMSCGKFIEYQRSNNTTQMNLFVQWVWGYLVAYNGRGFFDVKVGHAVSQVNLPDEPTVLLFLEQFCQQNPLSNVANGTTALLKSLGGKVVWNPPKQ